MDFQQVIRDRRSIRRYKDQEVEFDKIEQVLDAARLAPSWKNMQCWRFLVLVDAERRARIVEAFPDDNPGKKAIATAPVLIIVCADPKESGVENGIEYYIADAAIAFEHLCLSAHAHGLGSCWMGLFDEAQLKAAAEIPENIRVVGVTPLGYPDQEPQARPRKSLNEIAYFNRWGSNR